MIRIIVRSMSGFPDGCTNIIYRTFEIEDKLLEEYLIKEPRYTYREVVGAEVIAIKVAKQ